MDIQIRYINKSETKALLNFNRRNYHAGHILLNKKYLDWQFGSFPKKLKHYTILGAFYKKTLLGVMGLTFLDFFCFGKKVKCASFANLMVDKKFRNLGLGYILVKKSGALHPLALDHGLNDNALRLFYSLGWIGKNLERFAFVLKATTVKKFIGKNNLILNNSVSLTVSANSFEFVTLKQYDQRLTALFGDKKIKEKYPITVDRSRDYLNWRYFKHPLIKYHIFVAVKKGKIESFAVVRIEGPADFRAARLIDFISTNAAAGLTLSGVLDFCRQQKVNFIDYYFSGCGHKKILRQSGFIDCESGAHTFLPKLFNPVIAGGKTSINFVVKVNDNGTNKANKISNWYTTKGGGDQDRVY